MADSDHTPENLVDNIITYISTQRELYGDFPIQNDSAERGTPKSKGGSTAKDKAASHVSSGTDPEGNPDEDGNLPADNIPNVYRQIKQCKTLEELELLCSKAETLHTDLEGTRLVFGVGNPDADLMLVGEAPGAEEDRQGEPFVGKAGQLLNKILKSVNFSRDDVYIANILKHRPPNNRNPKPEERERSLPFLLRQIDLIRPKLILSLGKVSAQTLLDSNSSLSRMRGKFHPFRDKYELLATYHPAALLRHPKWKRPTWEDIQMLRKRYDELGCNP